MNRANCKVVWLLSQSLLTTHCIHNCQHKQQLLLYAALTDGEVVWAVCAMETELFGCAADIKRLNIGETSSRTADRQIKLHPTRP